MSWIALIVIGALIGIVIEKIESSLHDTQLRLEQIENDIEKLKEKIKD